MKALRSLNPFFLKYRGRLLIGLLVTIIAAVFKLVVPRQVGSIVDSVRRRVLGERREEEAEASTQGRRFCQGPAEERGPREDKKRESGES